MINYILNKESGAVEVVKADTDAEIIAFFEYCHLFNVNISDSIELDHKFKETIKRDPTWFSTWKKCIYTSNDNLLEYIDSFNKFYFSS